MMLQAIEDSRNQSFISMDGLRASVPSKQTLLVETEQAVKKQIETTIDEGNIIYTGDHPENSSCDLFS
jgi:hypothetical protein